jgi:hypothetical protein
MHESCIANVSFCLLVALSVFIVQLVDQNTFLGLDTAALL